MSNQIDNKVVSIEFDNSRFEKNVKTSMSTLDKLKQKLHLSGAAKGIEQVNAASKKVDMSRLQNGVETVHAKFSALEIMGITALTNITNKAVDAGMRIAKSLTIAPVADGWGEYEMTLNAVQTTMAGTGKTAEEVEKELKKLDEYADKTVYSTADMLNNLPKFTNAGIELETATQAMIGIANATALAGGDASKASIAFYNLGQAMSTGYLTRMDYNSINNAGIATMEWKKQMTEAAVAAGTLTKKSDDLFVANGKSFTLQQLFIDGLQEQWATTDVMMKVFGDYGNEETKIGEKAYAAAQDIKSFSMAMDSLKATAGTGWKDTWQIIFGGLEEAKKFWTPITEYIGGIISKMADMRNTVLGVAFGFKNVWKNITDKFDKAGFSKITKAVDSVKGVMKDLSYYQDVVNKVWRGDFNNHGDNPDRFDLLEKAGYDHRIVQDLVNKGYQYKLTMEDVEESHKKFGKSMEKTSESTKQTTKKVGELTDAQLKSAGLTNDEIKLYRALQEEANKLGISFDELTDKMSKQDGRSLLIDSFKNLWNGVSGVFKAIKQAYVEIFNPPGAAELGIKLYGLIARFNEFTKKLTLTDSKTGKLNDTGQKLVRTFKGIWALIDIILTVIGGPFRIAFKIIKEILGVFDIDILDITAAMGDAIVKFRDWIDKVIDFGAIFAWLLPFINKAKDAVVKWFNSSKLVSNIGTYFKNAYQGIKEWIKGLKETDNIPKYIFQGLINGFKHGFKTVFSVVEYLAGGIINVFKKVLGIHSPSTEFFDLGGNIIQGLYNGISSAVKMVYDLFMTIGTKLVEFVKGLDIGSVLAIATIGSAVFAIFKIIKIADNISKPFASFANVLDDVRGSIKAFKGVAKAAKVRLYAESVKALAIGIAILAGSIAVLSFLDQKKLWSAVGAIAVLTALLAGLVFVTSKFGGGLNGDLQFGKIALSLLGLAAAIFIMAIALRIMSGTKNLDTALYALAGMLVGIWGTLAILSKSDKNIENAGKTIRKLATALLVMTIVVWLLGSMDSGKLIQGTIAITLFAGIIVGLIAATKLLTGSKNIDKIGPTISKIALAMLMMVIVAKIAASMSVGELIQGVLAIVAFGAIIVGLMYCTKLINGTKNVDKIGGTIAKIAAAMLIMVLVAKVAASMSVGELIQGTLAIAAFAGIIVALMWATKYISGSKNIDKIGKTILMIAAAIAVLGLVVVLLGLIDISVLIKGTVIVAILSAMIGGLIWVTSKAKNCEKTLWPIVAAIAVLAIAIGVLSALKPARVALAAACMSAVMFVFSLLIKASKDAKKCTSTIIVLTIAVAAIAGVLFLLAQLPVERSLGAGIALSAVVLALSVALKVISSSGTNAKNATKGILALTAMVVPLMAFIAVIALMPKFPPGVSEQFGPVGILIGVMAGLLPILGLIGKMGLGKVMSGILALTAMVVPLIAFIAALTFMPEFPAHVITQLNQLVPALTVITLLLGPLTLVGLGGAAAYIGIGALITLIGGFALLATGIGALMEYVPGLQKFLTKGLEVLIQVAEGIGRLIGAFVGGLMDQICSYLPSIGKSLSDFAISVIPFIATMKLVDWSLLEGVTALAAAIIELSVAQFINGIMSLLSFGGSLGDLGKDLSEFAINVLPFITNMMLITPSVANGVKSFADAIYALTAANLMNSLNKLVGWLVGDSSLSSFGEEIGELGNSMRTFVDNLGTFTDNEVTTVDCACKAVKLLADTASTIPRQGGLFNALLGEKSLSKFGTDIGNLGTNLATFKNNLGTFGENEINTVDCAGQAISKLAQAADKIPAKDGLWQAIAGTKSIGAFASELPDTAGSIKNFISALTTTTDAEGNTSAVTFNEDQVAVVECAGNAIVALAKAADKIPAKDGLWQALAGTKDLGEFADDFENVGEGISKLISKVGDLDENAAFKVDTAVYIMGAMTGILDAWARWRDAGKNSLGGGKSLGKSITGLFSDSGKAIKDFVTTIKGVSATDITQAENIISFISSAIVQITDAVSTHYDELQTQLEDIVLAIGTTIDTICMAPDNTNSLKLAGKELINTILAGMEEACYDSNIGLYAGVRNIGITAAGQLYSEHVELEPVRKFKEAGKFLLTGLTTGLKNSEALQAVYDAAVAAGEKAVDGINDGAEINSPSKATKRSGKWLGEGLIIGMRDMMGAINNAGNDLGEGATGTISTAISRIADVVNNDIDAQPTIRPVLDLTDVSAGAGTINKMFGMNPSIGVLSKVGSINTMMNNRQNGNSEVISALKDLKTTIGNKSGDVYTFGNITYDGDSSVSDAVNALVRAIRIEGRV